MANERKRKRPLVRPRSKDTAEQPQAKRPPVQEVVYTQKVYSTAAYRGSGGAGTVCGLFYLL